MSTETHAQHAAFASALNEVFLIGALVALAGGLASLLLVRGRDLIATAPAPSRAVATSPVVASAASAMSAKKRALLRAKK